MSDIAVNRQAAIVRVAPRQRDRRTISWVVCCAWLEWTALVWTLTLLFGAVTAALAALADRVTGSRTTFLAPAPIGFAAPCPLDPTLAPR